MKATAGTSTLNSRVVVRVGLVLLMVGGLVGSASPAVGGVDNVSVISSDALVRASAFDGSGTIGVPSEEAASSFATFSESVTAFDDPPPNEVRSAEGAASQNTTSSPR
jgi:hypothetical protein